MKRRHGNEWTYPAENVTAVRPPGMKRAMMMMYAPRSSSVRSAHSKRVCAFSPPNQRFTVRSPTSVPMPYEMLSPTTAPAAPARITSGRLRSPAAAKLPPMTSDGLARHEREERVDHGDAEDDEVAPPLSGDPVADLLEVEPGGHVGGILAETR